MRKRGNRRTPVFMGIIRERCRGTAFVMSKGERAVIKDSETAHNSLKGGNMDIVITTYAAYVLVSVFLTVWVAHTLHKNGRVFLVEMFGGDESLADSVNHLLVVGFYLINFGYVSLALKIGYQIETARAGVEALSWKVGLVLI